MGQTTLDLTAIIAVITVAAGLITALGVIWKPAKKLMSFNDVISRELLGWTDPASGEVHKSLRAELRDIASRLSDLETRVNRLQPEDVADVRTALLHADARLERLEVAVAQLKHPIKTSRTKLRVVEEEE